MWISEHRFTFLLTRACVWCGELCRAEVFQDLAWLERVGVGLDMLTIWSGGYGQLAVTSMVPAASHWQTADLHTWVCHTKLLTLWTGRTNIKPHLLLGTPTSPSAVCVGLSHTHPSRQSYIWSSLFYQVIVHDIVLQEEAFLRAFWRVLLWSWWFILANHKVIQNFFFHL